MFLENLTKLIKVLGKKNVYVSSDDFEIINRAKMLGANTIVRSENLCGDVPDIPVYQHAITFMGKVDGIIAVHANNPTIDINLIEMTKTLLKLEIPEVMTCHPIERTEKYKDQNMKVNGSIRGMSIERLNNYGDPYKPNPEVWIPDNSLEIETKEDYDKIKSA